MSRVWVAAALAASCAAAGCAPRYYVQVADGFSSATATEGIDVRARQFTGSQLVDACRRAVPITRLEVVPERLDLIAGNVYTLGSLAVVAVTSGNVAAQPVPIQVEAQETSPPVLALRSDDPDLPRTLRAVAPGEFNVRIRTLCLGDATEVVIPGRVAPVTP